ncbi:MAG: hypothetical protein IT579_05220 [Verrucomicrobia subdivision 3 bacterium]|nr:hypothetical protein [Limisphaerales bacterium]
MGAAPVRPATNGIYYVFALVWKDGDLPTSVTVADVTDARAVILVNDPAPQLTNSTWGGRSAILPLNDSHLNWLQSTEDAVRIYRFNVATISGHEFQLDQAVTYSSRYTAFLKRCLIKHPPPPRPQR